MAYYICRSLPTRLVTRQVMFHQSQRFALRKSNPVLFQPSLSRFSTIHSYPPNTPSEESTSLKYLDEIENIGNRITFSTIMKLIVGAVLSFVPVDLAYALVRNQYNEYLLNNTVKKGTHPDVGISEDKFVPRPKTVERLKEILQPYEDHSYYHVVCGEHGTGKTTLVRKASRELKGVIYVEIPAVIKNIDDFGKAFGESLNFAFEEHISFSAQFMKKILGVTNGKDEYPKWKRALEAFKRAGEVYQAKNNKLPVIVYDNIAKLVNLDPEVLDYLQDDAKINADRRKYVAVFVSSEGSVPRRMESRSAWSRAKKPVMEIGDLDKKESMEYLIKKRSIKEEDAKKLYDLVGGRIVELKTVADDFLHGKTFEVIKQQVFGVVYNNLEKAEMNPAQLNHEPAKIIIKALINSNGILHISELRKKTKVEPSKLLENNVFAYHPENQTITFQSHSTECYVRENKDFSWILNKEESNEEKKDRRSR